MAKPETPAEKPEDETPAMPPAIDTQDDAAEADFVEDTDEAPEETEELVVCRVLKKGDGKIHTGRFNHKTKQAETYRRGQKTAPIARSTADELEERGFAEIEE